MLRKRRCVSVERTKLYKGFYEAKNIGRFEIVPPKTQHIALKAVSPYIVLDGAHNEAGASALAETLKTSFANKKILAVIGVLSDKAADKITASLCRCL